MNKQFYSFVIILCILMASIQKLVNPIIPGYHPDPSIIRVGDDYYIVNSSFQYFPGVPIFHSTDLINWEQIGNVLDRKEQLDLKDATSYQGIYAPTIRYHDGTFYMITTNKSFNQNFMVTAKDPKGPWSKPILLEQKGIDPSLYFEHDKLYFVSNPGDMITLCEIDPKTGKQLTPSRPIWGGTGGRYPEGPHIYKKDGFYYLLISEGGTEVAHMLTIARSIDIYGPYEPNPKNPILTNCSVKGQRIKTQGTGHGDLVQAKDGSWWIVFLAYRKFGGWYHHLGRETYLAPVEWKEGEWPIVNGGNPIDEIMDIPSPAEKVKKKERNSKIEKESPEWIYIQNPIEDNYLFEDERLTLQASNSTLIENKQPTFIGHRQESPNMIVETEINASSLSQGCMAGISIYQTHEDHLDFSLRKSDNEEVEIVLSHVIKSAQGEKAIKVEESAEKVKLRISCSDKERYVFEYSYDGEKYTKIGEHLCSLVSTEVGGGFTGVVLGMYAQGEGNAEFSYFDYSEKE